MIVFTLSNGLTFLRFVDNMSIEQIEAMMEYNEERLGFEADTTRMFR